jgi:hypothetical protein
MRLAVAMSKAKPKSAVVSVSTSGVLLAVAVALLGMAAGRVVSFSFERAGRWPWVFLVMETALAGLLLWER